MCLKSSLI
jgi:hypothetical protein